MAKVSTKEELERNNSTQLPISLRLAYNYLPQLLQDQDFKYFVSLLAKFILRNPSAPANFFYFFVHISNQCCSFILTPRVKFPLQLCIKVVQLQKMNDKHELVVVPLKSSSTILRDIKLFFVNSDYKGHDLNEGL